VAVRPPATTRFTEAAHVLVSGYGASGLGCSSSSANAWLFCSWDGLLSRCSTVKTGSCAFEVEPGWPADSEGG
jgi:hypothetical protein